ncbi:type II toxin-antitoxin system VapC family toxin [Amycolatopsis palatopharyngis]|uniref:type II toxin-antitoxin system VapC family toxin n=1 Tax=Amycolatopsis palatopharyngis TaxID=187982 RepID=UPI000E249D0E|nr:type II toxin-antitoxin system VapC family toxin [Amycolatopsis palatopharyngis]
MSDAVLFDTSVLIDPRSADLGEFATASPSVSAVTVAELAYGLDTHDPLERHVRGERLDWVLSRFPVLPFDLAEARLYGTLAALVRRAGRDPRPRRMDLQIAATAVTNSLPLLTRNEKDFTGLDRLLRVVPV